MIAVAVALSVSACEKKNDINSHKTTNAVERWNTSEGPLALSYSFAQKCGTDEVYLLNDGRYATWNDLGNKFDILSSGVTPSQYCNGVTSSQDDSSNRS